MPIKTKKSVLGSAISYPGICNTINSFNPFIRQYHNKPCPTLWRNIESSVNTLSPRQNGRHFADDIFKCIFTKEMFLYWLEFYWSVFQSVQLNTRQYLLMYCLGAEQATINYLKQCRPSFLTNTCEVDIFHTKHVFVPDNMIQMMQWGMHRCLLMLTIAGTTSLTYLTTMM